MTIAVQKYGGTSVATPEMIRRVARIVRHTHRAGRPTVVVVSARGDTTDELIRQALELNPAPSTRESDQLLATGENQSAALLAMALHEIGVPAVSLTGPQAGILADGRHGAGVIAAIDTTRVLRQLDDGNVVVVSGFQGMDTHGDIITLGRGGSDTTAVALAAALTAASCEIYTDVDGVYTADPRIVPGARVLSHVDAGVMTEMAFAGAQVLHSRAVELASVHGMDLQVRSSHTQSVGTTILGRSCQQVMESQGFVTAVAHDREVVWAQVRATRSAPGLATVVFDALAQKSVPVDLVSWSGPGESEPRLGFALHRRDLPVAQDLLAQLAAELGCVTELDEQVGKLSLVGTGLLNRPEYTVRMLLALAAAGITPSWGATTQLRSSVIIPADRLTEAVTTLHREFELDRDDAESMPA
ncbi:aspartate kinase [Crossiella sp. CA198]|uniref:aspartate kinase n=1 Tax=Crossiella sp. CA198 TaxID=3455607 RepID=UPI003F8D12D9